MGSRGRSSSSARSSGGGFRSSGSSFRSSSRSYSSSRNFSRPRTSSYGYGRSYRSSSSSSGLGFLLGLMMGKESSSSSHSTSYEQQGPTIPQYKKVRNKKATNITAIIFGVITLIFIILSACAVNLEYGRVMGTVIGKPYERYEWGEKYYYTSYEYIVDGRTYCAESQVGWTMLPDPIDVYIGGEYELYYKKSDPYLIYEIEDKSNLPTNKGLYLMLTIIFGITTCCILFMGIGKYQLNPEWEVAQKIAEEKAQLQGKKRCEYCSSIMEDSQSKCSSCGANLK